MLKPLKDVDIVCLLDPAVPRSPARDRGPAKGLSLLRDTVAAAWNDAWFDPKQPPAGKAVEARFPDCSYHFELVAAVDTGSQIIEIADQDDDAWKRSTTGVLIRLITERNQTYPDGWFTRCGWHAHQAALADIEQLPGLLFETLMYASVVTETSHQDAITAISSTP